jgi:exonuclease III/ribonuclease HI
VFTFSKFWLRLGTVISTADTTQISSNLVSFHGYGIGTLEPRGANGPATDHTSDDRLQGFGGEAQMSSGEPHMTHPNTRGSSVQATELHRLQLQSGAEERSDGSTTEYVDQQESQQTQPSLVTHSRCRRRGQSRRHQTPSHLQAPACKKNTRASLKVASLNMQGRWHGSRDKWLHINQILRTERIAILALQETHLTSMDEAQLNTVFQQCMVIYSSIDPQHTNAAGIAVVLNKNMTNIHGVRKYELIPGRALMVSVPWHRNAEIHVLAIYAPNTAEENCKFWEDINLCLANLPAPDVLLGDFNFVEDTLDRLPVRSDSVAVTDSFNMLKQGYQLKDGWRQANAEEVAYTYSQTEAQGGSASRIDRIYLRNSLVPFSNEWNITPSGIATDHQLVSARISDKHMPNIGKGRWTLPIFILDDKDLQQEIIECGRKLQSQIDEYKTSRSSDKNPQIFFKTFKDEVRSKCRSVAKKAVPKTSQKVKKLQSQLRTSMLDPAISEDEKRLIQSNLQEKINHEKIIQHTGIRDNLAARVRLEDEKAASKFWSRLTKDKVPRDTIIELERPDSTGNAPKYESDSVKMAKIARDYHENLQTAGLAPGSERRETTGLLLEKVHIQLSDDKKAIMEELISASEVDTVFKQLPNGKAAGIDGLPYELWKRINNICKGGEHNHDSFSIVDCLTAVYNDIEQYGIEPNTQFAEGWMCPLYKKNDRRKIENYRPITLLNSDYKILTKILALRLAKTAPDVLHPNQAGFISGRSITDQIKLTEMILEYAEAKEINGAIVALDQEKAYDKITHNYLWEVLEKFDFPKHFIDCVKALYSDADTSVIINGIQSSPFKVARGVRQGDPLSCLLFDLAIEPLAEMLRQSELKGFQVPGMEYHVVVTMFADDTTVYLTERDDYTVLKNILDTWCIASGAKFNVAKTEIMPIGTIGYRKNLYELHILNEGSPPLPDNIKIAKDGTAIRILGAWIGNKTNSEALWAPIMEKIDDALKKWERVHPSIEGRKIIIQRIIGSMTQYLAKAQGMPKSIENQLVKRTRSFIWDGEGKSTISMEMLSAPVNKGGKCVLNIVQRNEAIELTWLRDLIAPIDKRPEWAHFANELLNYMAQKSPIVQQNAKISTFSQTWKVQIRKLPKALQRILNVAKKYNLKLDALQYAPESLDKLPIWFHIGHDPSAGMKYNTHAAKCLRDNHKAITTGDIRKIANRNQSEHTDSVYCRCNHCVDDRENLSCIRPSECWAEAIKLYQAIPPKWNPGYIPAISPLAVPRELIINNHNSIKEKRELTFDPLYIHAGPYEDSFRIFSDREPANPQPVFPSQTQSGPQIINPLIPVCTIIVAGTHKINQHGDTIAGGCFHILPEGYQRSIKVPAGFSSTTSGEICALIQALHYVSKQTPVKVYIKSPWLIRSLTINLKTNEESGWLFVKDGHLAQILVGKLRSRPVVTKLQEWSGNIPQAIKENILQSAKMALANSNQDEIHGINDSEWLIKGMNIHFGSQKTFYRAISNTNKIARRATDIQIAITAHAVNDLSGKMPTPAEIWNAIRKRGFSRQIHNFLWKNLHNAYKIGSFWERIPNMETRGRCSLCNESESMEHIIVECPNSQAIRIVWNLAKSLWLKKENFWPDIRYGTILGCALAAFKLRSGKIAPGKNRLFEITITESAHLLWKLRCERVIKNQDNVQYAHSETEVHNRWVTMINRCLQLDMLMADRRRYGKTAIPVQTVLNTWSGTLKGEENLPANWIWQSGVLVGIASRRPPGRNR